MSKFKIGDKIRAKLGGVDIWVQPGKIYIVKDVVIEPAAPGNLCYRNCGHSMHDPKPERYYPVVDGELGKPATIWEECFELV